MTNRGFIESVHIVIHNRSKLTYDGDGMFLPGLNSVTGGVGRGTGSVTIGAVDLSSKKKSCQNFFSLINWREKKCWKGSCRLTRQLSTGSLLQTR